ncbi:MAG: exodeoxyribonuclease III [Spirochaetia bacterium]|nr:exodeoxyribonuclease III [Spirochaetia bacterium]
MKIISWNVNGIRAVERKKDLQSFIKNENPDLFFIQETKAKPEQLSSYLTENEDYFQHYHSAERAGYSGTGVWLSKKTFSENYKIHTGMPGWNDNEGRVLQVEYNNLDFFGIYFPNGGKSQDAWLDKLKFYDHFLKHVNTKKKSGRNIIWTGDLNVAHNELDLARPKENEGNIGFRPEERAWVDKVESSGWIDIFRKTYPDKISYTWWSLQTRARERNIGWRIDYFMTDAALLKKLKAINHLENQMGSDHCPVLLEIDIL